MPYHDTMKEAEIVNATDGNRASLIAKVSDSDAKETGGNEVKQELKHQEALDEIGELWARVHRAVSAAESACRKAKEADPDADPKTLFRSSMDDLSAVLEEITENGAPDVFGAMVKESHASRIED